MEELLILWQTPPEIIKNFTDNCITPDQLHQIEGELLKELCPTIGPRITLKQKITEYVTSLTDTITTTSNNDNIITDYDVENINIDDLLEVRPNLPQFDLKTLLLTSPSGKSILKYYEVSNSLSDKHRNQLTDIIIRHIFTYIVNSRITYEEYNLLAAKIISLFPAENIGTYFVPPVKKRDSIAGKPVFAKGKLVDKVRNILYKSGERKRKLDNKENYEPAKNQILAHDLKDENREKIVWLQNNTEPWEQVIENWKATYDIRSAMNYETVADFIVEWKILNDVRGEALINIDFDKKYPNASTNFFLKWDDFFNKVIQLKKSSVRDETLLNELGDLKAYTDNDKKAIKQLSVLCRLIPPKGRLNRKVKFSTTECIQSIVVNVENPGDIHPTVETVATAAKTNKNTVQPYLLACGTTDQYFLVIDTIKYNFISATKALDTLFKCYHTFHASYPKASDHIYLIIQRCVYGIKTKYDNVVPYIADVLALY